MPETLERIFVWRFWRRASLGVTLATTWVEGVAGFTGRKGGCAMVRVVRRGDTRVGTGREGSLSGHAWRWANVAPRG